MRHQSFALAMTKAATDCGDAAVCTAVTLAARLPLLTQTLVWPTAAGAAEWSRAGSEKVQAAWDGMSAATGAWSRVMMEAALRPPTPFGLASDMLRVTALACQPARRAVRANARRLTRD